MKDKLQSIALTLLILTLIMLSSWMGFAQAKLAGQSKAAGQSHVGAALIQPLPPMGWNSWYYLFQTQYPNPSWLVTETFVKANADALVSSGLYALGYNLVSVDATALERNSGTLRCIPAQFPSGCPALATYVHGKGMTIGFYETPADPCVVGTYNAFGFESVDATTMAGWGMDQFKYDACNITDQYSSDPNVIQTATQIMMTALQKTGRSISVLINYYDIYNSIQWYGPVGATTARIGIDNGDTCWYVKAESNWAFWTQNNQQNKGHYLDPDYLMGGLTEGDQPVGHCVSGTVGDTEAKAQFNWYAIIAAPLVIANQISSLSSTTLATYSNSEVIAVDQDFLGVGGSRTSQVTCGTEFCATWVRGPLANGDYAIALINYDPSNTHTVSVLWSDFGQSGTFNIRDLWSHSSVGSSNTGYSVSLGPWGSTMIRISK